MTRKRLLTMDARIVIYVLLPLLVVAAVNLLLFLVNRPAFLQKRDQVVVREPGRRFLGKPQPVIVEARKHLVFALLSQAVYQRKPDATQEKDGEILDPDATLGILGWTRWKNFPDETLQRQFATVHLRVEVWSNTADNSVAVAFGGTEFTNWADWKANLRWFLPDRHDEYTMIVTTFGDAFANKYQHFQQDPDGRFQRNAHIFATGHSLGGGLAQQFAYALPITADVPRVEHVYAFDPSPVTGYYSLKKDIREHNAKDLAIDRIYERGEILAIFRSLVNFLYPPSAERPAIRQVRYNLFSAWTAVAKHSIAKLAFRLSRVSSPRK
jgi:hypothetical protein